MIVPRKNLPKGEPPVIIGFSQIKKLKLFLRGVLTHGGLAALWCNSSLGEGRRQKDFLGERPTLTVPTRLLFYRLCSQREEHPVCVEQGSQALKNDLGDWSNFFNAQKRKRWLRKKSKQA